MAFHCSEVWHETDEYRSAVDGFCDGFEVTVGRVSKEVAVSTLAQLKACMQRELM